MNFPRKPFDLDSGTRQVLTVSLETLESESLYNLPDFDLTPIDTTFHLGDDPEHENLVIQGVIPGNAPEGLYEMHDEEEKKGGIFMPAWLCVLILVIDVAALALALLVSARTLLADRSAPPAAPAVEAPAVPAVEPTPEPVVTEPATPPPAETPAAETPAATVVEEPAAPVQPEPAPEAKETKLKLKWGDTLWDISEAYYKTPWLYSKIAKFNKIKNPNLIIAGTYNQHPAEMTGNPVSGPSGPEPVFSRLTLLLIFILMQQCLPVGAVARRYHGVSRRARLFLS